MGCNRKNCAELKGKICKSKFSFKKSEFNNKMLMIQNDNKVIGNIEYQVTNDVLEILNIMIKEEYKNQGFSYKTLKNLITNKVNYIDSLLVLDNKKAFLKTLNCEKKTLEEVFKNTPKDKLIQAVKETPAYKIRSKLGFGKIIDLYYDEKSKEKKSDGIRLKVARDE